MPLLATLAALTLNTTAPADEEVRIAPGDARFRPLEIGAYVAQYTSASSATGAFSLFVHSVDDGAGISLIDMIPMRDNVIVAQRRIDARMHAVDFSAGPYFAWGAEYVVSQMDGAAFDWTRVPIGGGEAVRLTGELGTTGIVSDMFSPTLAALLPMPPQTRFALPTAQPRPGGALSVAWTSYLVLRKERLDTPSGAECDCWVIEKINADGGVTHLWVDRAAPFIFKRHRDVGGPRELVSELLNFESMQR
ncbi:MAG: hypothetical protein AAGE01_12010 [Pseudomonadota bacterium]